MSLFSSRFLKLVWKSSQWKKWVLKPHINVQIWASWSYYKNMKSQLFKIDFLKISTLFFWSSWCQEFLSWGAPVYGGRVLAAPWSRVRVRPVTLICRSSPLSLSLSSHFMLTLLSFLFIKNMNKAKNLKSKKSIQLNHLKAESVSAKDRR